MKDELSRIVRPRGPDPAPPRHDGPDPRASATLAYDLAQRRLDRQLAGIDAIDTKLTTTFAGSVAVAAVYAATLALTKHPSGTAQGCFIAVIGTTVAVASLTFFALRTRNWSTGSRPEQVTEQLARGEPQRAVEWRAVRAVQRATGLNEPYVRAKAWALDVCLVTLFIEILLTLAGVLTI